MALSMAGKSIFGLLVAGGIGFLTLGQGGGSPPEGTGGPGPAAARTFDASRPAATTQTRPVVRKKTAAAGEGAAKPRPPSPGAAQPGPSEELRLQDAAMPADRQAWVDPPAAGRGQRTAVPQAGDREEHQAECRAKLVRAIQLHVLFTMEKTNDAGLRVVAGPAFDLLSEAAKADFARAMHCVAATGRDGPVAFDIVHWKSRKTLGRFASGAFTLT